MRNCGVAELDDQHLTRWVVPGSNLTRGRSKDFDNFWIWRFASV